MNSVTLLEPVPSLAVHPDAKPHPARATLLRMLAGYAVLTVVMLGVGMLLTHALAGSVGRWDDRMNRHFAAHRTPTWNDITSVATAALNTVPVVAAAVVLVGFLALRKHWREAVFLILALLLEITVFLSVTFIVARPRPSVHRLNSTPATSSFPSGHTAAATVLFVGLVIIVTCRTHSWFARAFSVALALLAVITVGFGRVYRGLHHPTDVVAGGLFGLACLFIAAIAVRAGSVEADRRHITPGEPAGDVRDHAEPEP
jgi:membrane-associated phospholipid phosphatase